MAKLPKYEMHETIQKNIPNPEWEHIKQAADNLITASSRQEQRVVLTGLVETLINNDAVDIKVIERTIKSKRKEK